MTIFVEPFDSTPFLRCIAKLRQRNGARMLPVSTGALRLVDTGNRGHSVRANLEKLVAIIERYIRQYPEQLVMLEPIWRNQVAEVNSTQ